MGGNANNPDDWSINKLDEIEYPELYEAIFAYVDQYRGSVPNEAFVDLIRVHFQRMITSMADRRRDEEIYEKYPYYDENQKPIPENIRKRTAEEFPDFASYEEAILSEIGKHPIHDNDRLHTGYYNELEIEGLEGLNREPEGVEKMVVLAIYHQLTSDGVTSAQEDINNRVKELFESYMAQVVESREYEIDQIAKDVGSILAVKAGQGTPAKYERYGVETFGQDILRLLTTYENIDDKTALLAVKLIEDHLNKTVEERFPHIAPEEDESKFESMISGDTAKLLNSLSSEYERIELIKALQIAIDAIEGRNNWVQANLEEVKDIASNAELPRTNNSSRSQPR